MGQRAHEMVLNIKVKTDVIFGEEIIYSEPSIIYDTKWKCKIQGFS